MSLEYLLSFKLIRLVAWVRFLADVDVQSEFGFTMVIES